MSPEQARGKAVDKRADVWAFGCVLDEMLTGRRAFDGEDVSDTIASILRGDPDWSLIPSSISPTVRQYLKRCLAKDPGQRVHDIADMRLALEGAFDVPVETPSTATTVPPSRWRRRRWRWRARLRARRSSSPCLARSSLGDGVPRRPAQGHATHASCHRTASAISPSQLDPDVAVSRDGSRVAFDPTSKQGRLVLLCPGARSAGDTSASRVRRFPACPSSPRMASRLASSTVLRSSEFRRMADQLVTIASDRPGSDQGASWGEDGSIVFATNVGEGPEAHLRRRRGAVMQVTTEAGGRDATSFPEILPGGRAVLFTRCAGRTARLERPASRSSISNLAPSKTLIAGRKLCDAMPRRATSCTAFPGRCEPLAFDLKTLTVRGTPDSGSRRA